MIKFFLTFLICIIPSLALAQKTPEGVIYDIEILRVVDGDTIVIAAPYLPPPLKPQLSVRVFGVDTPEKGRAAKCEQEAYLALRASEYTRTLVKQSQIRKVVIYGWDKYGGRILGDFVLNGESLRQQLLQNGFAREYYGGGQKSWCTQ